jgi:uncharacterized OB-fold protein
MPAELRTEPFPGVGPQAPLLAPSAADTQPFHRGLGEGRLLLQCCERCSRARYPLAPVCPYCTAAEHRWLQFDGLGTVHSWVRYRRAFHPSFASLVPYVVVSAELDAGPRMFGRLLGGDSPEIGSPVKMLVERWEDGGCAPAFETCREKACDTPS